MQDKKYIYKQIKHENKCVLSIKMQVNQAAQEQHQQDAERAQRALTLAAPDAAEEDEAFFDPSMGNKCVSMLSRR